MDPPPPSPGLFGGGPRPDRGDARRVRDLVRAAFGLGDDAVVTVTELRCHDDGCPPVETVIAIFGPADGERSEHRLHLAVAEIAPAHVWQLAAGEHGCCR